MAKEFSIGEYLAAKERMRNLSSLQRKIVDAIHHLGEMPTNTEIARYCFSTHQTVSSTLSVLKGKKIVNNISFGRNSYWNITDLQICQMLDIQKQPRNNL
ncbi:hypothetical protein [Microcoleus sp. Pol12B5]|uniref:hypothetical protein n=1 Tax=Microcoleus sp. Pol12B5 TaxID=3055396 RepID=UPI002FCF1103